MKTRLNPFLRSASLAASIVLCLGSAAHAATFYWDTDGSGTAGFGTAGGTWGSSTFWGTAAAGNGATANTAITTADTVNFGTNSAGLAAGTITGPATAEGFLSMTFGSASGAIALSGGTLDVVNAGTSIITVNNTAATVSSVLQGAGNLIKTGTGTLTLSGLNTHTLATTVSVGTLKVGNVDALGTAGSGAARTVIVNGATLELATDSSLPAEWLDCGSGVTGTVIVNRESPDVGITQSLGLQYLGTGAKLNVAKGDNVTSGTATLGLAQLSMSGSSTGTATFNPTTAAVSVTGDVKSGVNFAKTLILDGTNANNAISGIISNGSAAAGVSLLKSGTSTWTLSNANTYTGATTITGGTLSLSGSLTGSNVSTSATGVLTQTSAGVIDGSVGFTQGSSGTSVLAGANTYTGNTTITGGTLTLDYTADGNKIADDSVLVLGGGRLNLANGAILNNEEVASTSLNVGASVVTQTSSASVLRMNGITRNVGSTVNFGAANIADTDTDNSSNGILGGWATVAGTDWAKSVDAAAADTAITAYTGYTADIWVPANNVNVTGDSSPTSDSTANSLRFNAAGASTITLAGINTLTTGGILVTSNVGDFLSKITGGTLIGASEKDLVVTQNNPSNGLTIESIIANNTTATALTKSGAGLLTLTNANTYTGGTYVNGGTLVLASTSQTTGAVSVAAGAVLELKNATAFANLVTLTGLGTVRINGTTNFGTAADVISLSIGALIDVRVNNLNGGSSSNKVYTNNFSSLNVESGATFSTSNVGVRMDALTGLGNIDASSSNTGGSFTFGVGNSNGSFGGKFRATNTNKFNYTKLGTGTQTLSGVSDYTSTMNVNAGVLAISGSGTLGASTAGLTLGGGQLDLGTTSQTVGAVSVTGAYGSGDTIRNGNITGASYAASNASGNAIISANLLVNGAAAFAKSGAGSVTLTGVNTYTGGTAVNHGVLFLNHIGDSSPAIKGNVAIAGAGNNTSRGVLFLNASNQLESTASVSMSINTATYNSYADFVLGGNSQTISGLTFTGTLGNQNIENAKADAQGVITSNGTLTINNSSDITVPSTVTIRDKESGLSTGTLAITKSGAGTLTLSNTNTYTGPTTVNGGTLHLTTTLAAASAVTVGGATATGTPTLTGAGGTVNGTLNIAAAGGGAAGTVSPGTVGTTGTLNAGATTLAGTYACDVTASATDLLAVNGSLTLTGATLAINAVAPAASSYTIATYTGATPAFTTVTGLPSGYTLDYATAGVIKLVQSAPTGYFGWASANADNQAANLDFDNDGVDNGVEYFLGETGSGFTTSPSSFTANTATWTNGGNIPAGQYGTQFVIQTSTDLVAWTPILAGNPSLNNQAGFVAFTLTGSGKQFARLIVTPN